MQIFHAADIHLGRRRLDGKLPDADFADAFAHVARAAIAARAEVFLLAGDLFDRAQVEPPHLRQAQRVLGLLKEARIPVIAIEGNHDRTSIVSQAPTWLDYLAQDELLVLLRTPFDASGPFLGEWNAATKRGAWIDLGGVRFTGAGYLGAATPHKVRQIVERLDPARSNVLLLHAGPDYFVGEGGGFSADDLAAIHERVRYLALGHIHRPMLHGGWACNPGSPENCDLREAQYDRDRAGNPAPRGYARIQLDSAQLDAPVEVTIASNPRRPIVALELDCTPYGNKLKDGNAAIEAAAAKLIAQHLVPPSAAVELRLVGRINLNRIALAPETLARNVEAATGVLAVCVDATAINLDAGSGGLASTEEGVSRETIERAAIRQLVGEEALWGLEGCEDEMAGLFYELKELVRTRKSADELAEKIGTSALVEKIREAKSRPMEEPAQP